MSNRFSLSGRARAAVCLLSMVCLVHEARAQVTIFSEDFTAPSAGWSYMGVNAGGTTADDLIRLNGSGGVRAEYDQSNSITPVSAIGGPPTSIVPSILYHDLPRVLRDTDSFQVRASMVIEPGSIPATGEGYQLANLSLINLDPGKFGPDRTLADSVFSPPNNFKDSSNTVEFNYFINNSFGGPSTSGIIAADNGASNDGIISYGDFFATQMNGSFLPEGTPLYIELDYSRFTRQLTTTVFSDAARTTILSVGGAPQQNSTTAISGGNLFSLKQVAFPNYVAINFTGGPNGSGVVTWDNLHVVFVPEPGSGILALLLFAVAVRLRRCRG